MDLVDELSGRALFAVPKKGRLYEKCVHLLKNIDVRYVRKERLDIAIVSNFNLALVFLPAHDIALYVSQGRVDMGITGQDIVAETEADVNEVMRLGFGQCRLCLLTPKKHKVGSPKVDIGLLMLIVQELIGKRIVTSFPELTKKYFQKLAGNDNSNTSVKYVSGSVEIACPLGLAEGLVDLVESGTTINAAGLEILDVLMTTEAVLITNKHSPFQDLVDKLSRRIVGVITAEKYVMVEYNVERKHLEQASKITPGMQSPTVSPLEDNNWVAVKSMIKKDEANDKLDKLQEIGATAILITAIQNCRI